jgi:flavin-dependent dehydrogenase
LDSVVQKNPSLKTLLRSSERVGSVRSVYPVYFAPRRCYADGLLLTGDAARVSEPVTGEGVYFALRSGVLAGEVLHGAFQNHDCSARTLRAYAVACRREFRLRQTLNKAIHYAIHRPRLLTPVIQFSQKRRHLLDHLVRRLCFPNPSPSPIPMGEGGVRARL